MKYKLLCLFVLLSFSLSDLYADIELSSKQMRTSDGLPSNSVRCMFQDSKGFLWLGTLDGLTRYDGNTFLTYQLESGKHDRISLADNRIKHVSLDIELYCSIVILSVSFKRSNQYKVSLASFNAILSLLI